MKYAIAITLALLCLTGCQDPAKDQQIADLLRDNTELSRQLDEADKEHAKKSAAATQAKATLEGEFKKQLKAADLDRQHLQSELRTAGQEKADLLRDTEKLQTELAAAQKEAREAAKTALKAARDSCPPPEVIPKETQAQEFAPSFQKPDGSRTWRTDYDWDEAKAKDLHRLQFVCWATRSCPHCDWFLTQCSNQSVGADVFRQFVPCWITVQDRATSTLADQFGVNKFRYPAAMLRDPVSGKFEMWRPSKDNATLQSEIAEHAKALK